ncbi:hypothetical protein PIB30_019954 [Stylosanthes scabra]|uniref:Uncharacterized protein n=1 Tax=Stylosanthes scabra TaxID=79078 RepID=A0ABU6X7Z2_9FABA|nr:hypothetical protein [Stylosanthes scabra]
MNMGHNNIVCAIIGFSASFLLCVPTIKRWQRKQEASEKLKLVTEALETAEERVMRYQERHDRILNQICQSYLTNTELVRALDGARVTMNEVLEFAIELRTIQLKIIGSFPDAIDVFLDTSK